MSDNRPSLTELERRHRRVSRNNYIVNSQLGNQAEVSFDHCPGLHSMSVEAWGTSFLFLEKAGTHKSAAPCGTRSCGGKLSRSQMRSRLGATLLKLRSVRTHEAYLLNLRKKGLPVVHI